MTLEEHARLAWPILCQRAATGDEITYGELAEEIGSIPVQIGRILSLIQEYCLKEELPPLTILVVQAGTRAPGKGFIAWDAGDIAGGMGEVYAFGGWQTHLNPFDYATEGITRRDLERELVRLPEQSGPVYRLVRDRGMSQTIFRDVLRDAYDDGCAFCRLTWTAALEAAHILPWNDLSASERLNARWGLLLCAVHHKLFDACVITLDVRGKIQYLGPETPVISPR
jgi:putative restriction endonuclease